MKIVNLYNHKYVRVDLVLNRSDWFHFNVISHDKPFKGKNVIKVLIKSIEYHSTMHKSYLARLVKLGYERER